VRYILTHHRDTLIEVAVEIPGPAEAGWRETAPYMGNLVDPCQRYTSCRSCLPRQSPFRGRPHEEVDVPIWDALRGACSRIPSSRPSFWGTRKVIDRACDIDMVMSPLRASTLHVSLARLYIESGRAKLRLLLAIYRERTYFVF
jgi:hypothetical protein